MVIEVFGNAEGPTAKDDWATITDIGDWELIGEEEEQYVRKLGRCVPVHSDGQTLGYNAYLYLVHDPDVQVTYTKGSRY